MTSNKWQARKQDKDVKKHIVTIVEKHDFDFYVTVTFAHGQFGPLRRHHVADAERMVKGYVNKLRTLLYGRGNKQEKGRFIFACWFEDKDKFRNTVPLHAHMLLLFPQKGVEELERETRKYWTKVGSNSPHRFVPSIDIQTVYDVAPLADYNGKNTEDAFTIESMILFGISDSRD